LAQSPTISIRSEAAIAFALRKTWGDLPIKTLTDYQEIPGQGVQARIGENFYELKKVENNNFGRGPQIGLFRNGLQILELEFESEIRPESKALIQFLYKMRFQVLVLSGDNQQSCQILAQKLNLPIENIFSNCSPQEKQNILNKYSNSLFIGDGVNDTLVMSSAQVSVAIGGSALEALRTADIHIQSNNLFELKNILLIAHESNKVLVRNLGLAIAYNIAAGSAALLGWVNPLAAAVLMPMSSVAIILSAYLGTRKLRKLGVRNEFTVSDGADDSAHRRGVSDGISLGRTARAIR
jgi:Cu2+-exporting ATPase/Cu+-exporting ATPase